jgi:hypothetical protein
VFEFVIISKSWATKIAIFRQIRSANRILSITVTPYGKKPLNNQSREGNNMKVALYGS